MTIEATMEALTDALKQNTATLERVIVGQQAALEKLEGVKPATTRTRKPKEDAPAADDAAGNAPQEAAPTASATPAATPAAKPAADARVVTQDDLRKAAGEAKAKDEAGTLALMKSLLSHFGSPKLVGPESTLDADQLKQAEFYLKRLAAGCSVDLKADYDFDGDPAQGDDGGATANPSDSDDF